MFSRTIAVRAGSAALAAPCRSCTRSFGMPLRAKIISAEASSRAQMSTQVQVPKDFKQRPEDDVDDVLFNSTYGLRTIQLNRPKKLNSLNASMIRKILPRLVEWEKSDMANVVVMKGAGEKAFCAGGDVAELAKYNQEDEGGWKKSAHYFALEYKLDHYIATYGKPYVAFMDGITMGGGVGLSVHAPFRIATERTVFAMPETTIGFFPDVGASFFLPRMNGYVGTYLALTSERLRGVNAFYSGIATHYLHSTTLPQLESRLAELRFQDDMTMEQRLQIIASTLEEFSTGVPHDEPMAIAGDIRRAIDRCFRWNTIPEIIAALEQERGEAATGEWAEKTLETLHQRSPTAVNVALKQMRIGATWSIAETFKREHQIATKFMKHPDFTEGVTALLVRKETPKWQPATLGEVDTKATSEFFRTEGEELKLLNNRDYKKYPYAHFGVPTEKEVRGYLSESGYARHELMEKVIVAHKRRQGTREIMEEMLERKLRTSTGPVKWRDEEKPLPELKKEE
ncbi:3-hydroxyisobutyryl-CoA hydrolase (enoyl-CoA hydratase/isomerase) [Colletotrichum plurivorum]|uniref:3-hydroxyisobutyryl-CoA hydrolase n=1 Tax=Colletotrichum plurivorum TaxID=2175906 RepID=A0A8H6NSJ3_9PEZI|nr:3-hydroxyisobutyryl-CoA hydrolase (enoyl-CoA hydratase/isomerase) [Colletotrichum plurivorum]